MRTWQPPRTGRTRLGCSDEREPPQPDSIDFISLERIGSIPGRHATNEANGGLVRLARAEGLCDDGLDGSDRVRDRNARFCRRSPACAVRHMALPKSTS
mmetsp:Transcript_29188/g.69500  ORF Transcript_29188/g.69500 Transcript_29188/m.69500 type:complete len:99 (-) Transcript_29188:33-329(-)